MTFSDKMWYNISTSKYWDLLRGSVEKSYFQNFKRRSCHEKGNPSARESGAKPDPAEQYSERITSRRYQFGDSL